MLINKHAKFVNEIFVSSKLDKNPYSGTPTVIFLGCTFLLLYLHFYKITYSRWRTGLYKSVVFHWAYFYITRMWLLFVKFGRFLIDSMDQFIEENSPKDEIVLNQTMTHICIFIVMLLISLIPLVFLILQQIYKNQIPNFFTWVTVDRRLNSEIGTSGQYLERPAHFPVHNNKKRVASYQSKRSTSFSNQMSSDRESSTFRPCKSMITINDSMATNLS